MEGKGVPNLVSAGENHIRVVDYNVKIDVPPGEARSDTRLVDDMPEQTPLRIWANYHGERERGGLGGIPRKESARPCPLGFSVW